MTGDIHLKAFPGFVLVLLVIIISLFMCGCGSETEVRYVAPTGHAADGQQDNGGDEDETSEGDDTAEDGSGDDSENYDNSKDSDESGDDGAGDTGSQDGGDSADTGDSSGQGSDEFQTVIESVHDDEEVTPETASIDELEPRLCGINDVMLGYVGCYYNEDKSSVRLTLKNSGRGELDEIWFYIKTTYDTDYTKAAGLLPGHIKDYRLPLEDWTEEYGNIDSILATPVITEDGTDYACNNRQMLIRPQENCLETNN
ncbi:MAG: hypothetical protein R6U32_02360 [Candidatus Woesearchaeota archaeon]